MTNLHHPSSITLPWRSLKKLQATEMRCFGKLLGIPYRDHIINDVVRNRIRKAIGPLRWYLNHSKETQVKVVWAYIKISRACQENCTSNSARREKQGPTKEGLRFCNALREAANKIKWRKRVAMSVAPQRSPWLRDRCKVQRSPWKTPCH